MDTKLILEAARGTLDGTLSFPEVVGKLLAAGVEYFHVDYQCHPIEFIRHQYRCADENEQDQESQQNADDNLA